MTIDDKIITIRNRLVNPILGVDPNLVLNQVGSMKDVGDYPVALAIEIKGFLNQIKGTALSLDGSNVAYNKLSGMEEYKHFTTDWTAKLKGVNLDLIRSQQDQLAFWINLYNVLTLDAVIRFGIRESITEGWLGVLSFFERAAYNIGGYRFSLSDIEHGILRGNKGVPYFVGPHFASKDPRRRWVLTAVDPRVHFALNCASRSCPPIGVYTPDRIDNQLDQATKNFVNEDVEINPETSTISLSAIFKWYQSDFHGKVGTIQFLLEHLPEDDRRSFIRDREESLRLNYKSYDWRINDVT